MVRTPEGDSPEHQYRSVGSALPESIVTRKRGCGLVVRHDRPAPAASPLRCLQGLTAVQKGEEMKPTFKLIITLLAVLCLLQPVSGYRYCTWHHGWQGWYCQCCPGEDCPIPEPTPTVTITPTPTPTPVPTFSPKPTPTHKHPTPMPTPVPTITPTPDPTPIPSPEFPWLKGFVEALFGGLR